MAIETYLPKTAAKPKANERIAIAKFMQISCKLGNKNENDATSAHFPSHLTFGHFTPASTTQRDHQNCNRIACTNQNEKHQARNDETLQTVEKQ